MPHLAYMCCYADAPTGPVPIQEPPDDLIRPSTRQSLPTAAATPLTSHRGSLGSRVVPGTGGLGSLVVPGTGGLVAGDSIEAAGQDDPAALGATTNGNVGPFFSARRAAGRAA